MWTGQLLTVSIKYLNSLRRYTVWVKKVTPHKVTKLDMKVNAKKCSILRFGVRYLRPCVAVTIEGNVVEYSGKAKYLGVMLLA